MGGGRIVSVKLSAFPETIGSSLSAVSSPPVVLPMGGRPIVSDGKIE